jgi:transcription antitermination factor NusG
MHTDNSISSFETAVWYALHVRHNHEKTVSTVLRQKGYSEFLPTYRARRRWSDRSVEIEFPLFPGYLFCQLDPGRPRTPIVTTPGVIRLVGGSRGPIPVEANEIAAVHKVVSSGIVSEPWPFLEAGQKVRIEHGALAGVEGILIEVKNKQRLIVSVSLLQRSINVDIESSDVVPVNPVWHPAALAG